MDIKELMTQDFDLIKKELSQKPKRTISVEECLKQYDPKKHSVFDETKRPKKKVTKATDQKDDKGNIIYRESMEEVARIAVPFQKIVVDRAVGFLLSNPIELKTKYKNETETAKKLFTMLEKVWEDNKLDFDNCDIAEILFSECEVAELWYLIPAEDGYWENSNGKFKLKLKILSESRADKLYPHFNSIGDMDAFSREYTLIVNGQKEEHFDIYTAEATYKYYKSGDKWDLFPIEGQPNPMPNQFQKIPVIYYKQDQPDWTDVQSMIERYETSMSNHADTNDYSGSPITVVKGQVTGFASKGEQGKVLTIDKEGDIKYLESKNAPESVKLERTDLKELILTCTQTPDISFQAMSGLGNISGVTLKNMFLDAHMKANKKARKDFGKGIQRRINLLKAIIGKVIDSSLDKETNNLSIKPVFTPYLPKNVKEFEDMIRDAVATGYMSKQTGAEKSSLIDNPEEEYERLKGQDMENMGASFE